MDDRLEALCSLFESLAQADPAKAEAIVREWPDSVVSAHRLVSDFATFLLHREQFSKIDPGRLDAMCVNLASVLKSPLSDALREMLRFLGRTPARSMASSVDAVHAFVHAGGIPGALALRHSEEAGHRRKSRPKRPNMVLEENAEEIAGAFPDDSATLDDFRRSGFMDMG